MNKKLLAVAVAGALAAPGVALAQSSVTISGFIKMSFQNYKINNYSAARPAGGRDSQTLVHDNSSRIIFNVVEDLGGGLRAIAQIDWRVTPDTGTDAISGNNHVGLQSKTWGRVHFGRQDLHYFGRESNLTVAGDLQADSISLLSFIANANTGGAGSAGVAIAGATRTPNTIHYTTPSWGGFNAVLAYSTSGAAATESDINSTTRRGRAWNIAPTYQGRNFTIGYSYWSQKTDAAAGGAAAANQRADRLFGSYRWGGFHIGLAWDKSKLDDAISGARLGDRTAWSVPIEYTWGPHWIGGHYTKARDDKSTAAQDGARMFALGYAYSLSKRTSLAVTYASIRNDAAAHYTPFTANGGLGGGAPHAAIAGEDPRFISTTLRHVF